MRITLLLSYLILSNFISYGQPPESGNVSQKDSLDLIGIWKQFISIVKSKDTTHYKNISTEVATITNYYGKSGGRKYDVVRDTVRNILFRNLCSSNIWSLIEQNKLILSFGTSSDFATYKLKPNKQKKYRIFELKFEGNHDKPDENFGISCSFEFIKSDGLYYFKELSVQRN